jgi:DNA-binding NarL/FixJ family response regulator
MKSDSQKTSAITVLIADDHAVLRAGLKLLISTQSDMQVVGEAENGLQALERVQMLQPDILLLDLAMPGVGGLEILRQLVRTHAGVSVLVLTMHEEENYLRQALEAGAAGYVPKSAADTELLSAIRAVAKGDMYIHPSQTKSLLGRMLPESVASTPSTVGEAALSDREQEVVKLVALGHTNQQVADQLHLSVKTVETYRARAMQKLGLRSRAALVRYAIEDGMIRG